jgi:subtilisin family serine protease
MTVSVARNLLLGLAAWFAAVALAPAGVADQPRPADGDGDGDQQVLVLLRLPAQHYRPNADYSGGYGDGAGRGARMRIAKRLAQQYGVALSSEWPMPLLGVDCFVMTAPPGQSPGAVAARLSRDPDVSWSEPMHTYHGQGEAPGHNDPLFRAQPAAGEWRLAELHKISTGRNVRVAVIDSMVDRTHPDLAGQVDIAENFVVGRSDAPEQHGTGVAGIIAARTDNGLGIAGVAPNARLMALRACWQEQARPSASPDSVATVCNSLSLAKAINFAIDHNAQIINLSLSGPPDALLGKLLDVALARGTIVVGAFDRDLRGGGFPASHAGVIAVADEAAEPAVPGVFSAPGRGIPTTQPGGRWFLVNGSSYAAAHVSGLFALLRERAPRVHSSLTLVTARPSDTIDACATISQTTTSCGCNCPGAEILASYRR